MWDDLATIIQGRSPSELDEFYDLQQYFLKWGPRAVVPQEDLSVFWDDGRIYTTFR
jgi:hypothetical protein